MHRASGVPAGTQHGGGLRCTHRWFPLARPRFTTGYRPWCLRHPSTFMKCTTSLQQGCSEPLRSPQHTMRHQDLRKHRHAWQHSLGVVRQPGGLAACSRLVEGASATDTTGSRCLPVHPSPHPGRDASQRLLLPSVCIVLKRALLPSLRDGAWRVRSKPSGLRWCCASRSTTSYRR